MAEKAEMSGPHSYYRKALSDAQAAANRDRVPYYVIARTCHTQGSGTQYQFCHPERVPQANRDGWYVYSHVDPDPERRQSGQVFDPNGFVHSGA